MKQSLLVLGMIFFCIPMISQNETFSIPENVGDELQNQYIVIYEEGTPEENYNKVINYINRTYNTPSEVIKSQINGVYVRIEGISDLFKNGGVWISTKHSLEFKFKKDKIKLTVLNLTTADTGLSVIDYCTYNKTHKSNGNIKRMMMNYATKVTEGVNKLAEEIKIGITTNSESNDDDW